MQSEKHIPGKAEEMKDTKTSGMNYIDRLTTLETREATHVKSKY